MSVFRLAFHFKRPVSELNLSWREFQYWLAFLDAEPPDYGDNYRTALVLSQITNMAGRSLPDKKRVSPEDFMGKPEPLVQTEADIKTFMLSLRGSQDGISGNGNT